MPTATPAGRQDDMLTVVEVCEELKVPKGTFYYWRHKGTAPRCIKLPSGGLRVRRDTLEDWLTSLEGELR